MELSSLYNSEVFKLIVIPVLIFLARLCDVTLDTLRVIYISRGMKFLAPLVGFLEILIWLTAISQIINNLSNISYYIAYAGGFAMGNFIGIYIEERMAIGTVVIRIITQKEATELINMLIAEGYGVTHVDAQGAQGPVKIIFTIVKRKNIKKVLTIVRKCNPQAFFTIEDVRSVREGVYPGKSSRYDPACAPDKER
jgi:uncharacterized protein YebE (UPF0316 family)